MARKPGDDMTKNVAKPPSLPVSDDPTVFTTKQLEKAAERRKRHVAIAALSPKARARHDAEAQKRLNLAVEKYRAGPPAKRGVIFLDPVTLKQVRQPIVVMETFGREDYAEQWQVDFGQKLAAARVKTGISQSELARRSGLQQSHISKLEGGRMEPRVTTIFTLADAIGIRAGDLFPVDQR